VGKGVATLGSDNCFYCQKTFTDDVFFHPVTFIYNEDERDEYLCPECYKEWLEGVKD
jgi:hypothetical protein